MHAPFSRRPPGAGATFALVVAALLITGCTSDTVAPRRAAPGEAASAAKQSTTAGRMLVVRLVGDFFLDQVFSMADDGTDAHQVTNERFGASQASWAPDGKQILYSGAEDLVSMSIFSVFEDGTTSTKLTSPAPGCRDEFPIASGKRIVFTRACPGGESLAIMNADGKAITMLVSSVADIGPSPSPKTGQIAYVSTDRDIYIVDPTTHGLTNLTNTTAFMESDPAFSPSGKQVLFTRWITSNNEVGIFVMNADGTGVTQLTSTASNVFDTSPHWSPDGKKIAFTSSRDGASDVFVMNANGTGLTNLTKSADFDGLNAWAP